MHKENIYVVNQKMTILIIDDYDVSIRPCELINMLKIFGVKEKYKLCRISKFNDFPKRCKNVFN